MITFTKEQLIASAHARIEFAEMMLSGELEPLKERTWSIELELARIALASLEAEPVAWAHRLINKRNGVVHPWVYGSAEASPSEGDIFNIEVMPLYAAPPAPVSESEPMKMYGIGSVFKPKILSGVEVDCDNCSHYQPNVCHGEGCPAAMLQGAEPVTTANKLRDAVEIIRNSGIEIDAEKIFAERDVLNTPDCWCRTCRPVTVTDMRFVVCPDCGNKRCPHANDHRNACTGSNEPGQEGSAYPAAPQQEAE